MDKIFKLSDEEFRELNLLQYKKKLYQHFNPHQNPHEKSAISLHIECVVLPSTHHLLNYPAQHSGELIPDTTQLKSLWKKRLLCFLYLFYLDCLNPIVHQILYHLQVNLSITYSPGNDPMISWTGALSFPYERKICILTELVFLLRLVALFISLTPSSGSDLSTLEISELLEYCNHDTLWLKHETLDFLFNSKELTDEPRLMNAIQVLFSTPHLLNKISDIKDQYESFSLGGMKSHGLYPKILNQKSTFIPPEFSKIDETKSLSELMNLCNMHFGYEESLFSSYSSTSTGNNQSSSSSTASPLSRFETKFVRPAPPLVDFNPDYEFMWISDVNTYSTSKFINDMKHNSSPEYHVGDGFDIDSTHLFCLYELNSSNKGGFMSSNHQRNQSTSPNTSTSSTEQSGVVLMKRGKTSQENELNELFSTSFKQQLQPVQIRTILQNFDKLTMLTDLLTPNRLPDLVKHNRELASKCLQSIIHAKNKRLNEYLSVLISMPVSLQLLEVVNNLLNKNDPITTLAFISPIDDSTSYLHTLLRNCVIHCHQSVQDPPSQTRKVRLVCVFVQRLIRDEIFVVNPSDFIYTELQSFCLEFVKIKESADLYQLLSDPKKK